MLVKGFDFTRTRSRLATGCWLLAIYLIYDSYGILKQVQNDSVGKTFPVIRLPSVKSHVAHKYSYTVHGSRFTVSGQRTNGRPTPSAHQAFSSLFNIRFLSDRMTMLMASSQKPGASSDLAHNEKTVYRYPFTVYRPSQRMWRISTHTRLTVHGPR